MARIIEIPDWCEIGKYIEWSAPKITGFEWVKERILGYSDVGFFHQGDSSCPVYHTKFSEFGKTVRLKEPDIIKKHEGWSYYEYV